MNKTSYKHFGDYVDSFTKFENRLALTVKPFIKIERLSYGELQKRSYQTANFLTSKGIKKGHRVMIIAPNSPQWVELLLGAQLIGATIVPVDVRSNLDTILSYSKQTSPNLVFRNKHIHPEIDSHFEICIIDDLDSDIAKFDATAPKVDLMGSETAVIVFTSGTTADPKGVVLSQQNVLSNVSAIQQALTIEPDWRFLSVLPLSHMYEFTGGCLLPLSNGASIFYLPRVTPLAIARGLAEYRITTILSVPQLLILFLQQIRHKAAQQGRAKAFSGLLKIAPVFPFSTRRYLFHSVHSRLGGKLDIVVTGGAPIPLEVSSSWEYMGVKMVQGYGLTETSPVLTFNRPNNRRLDSQGQALNNVKLRVAALDHEIQAKGPGVFDHYLDNKVATKNAFTEDGWFRTGDIGSLDNGWLKIQGRAKFAIVLSSGLKVFPEDIELVADKFPDLKSICIVGLNRADGEIVKAVIISDKNDEQVEGVISQINNKLESFQHISEWVRWPDPDFPRTRLLKIDRKTVGKWANNQDQANHGNTTSGNILETDILVNIVRLVLDKPGARVKDSDKLSDLGVDSLRRLAVVSLVEEQLNVSVPEAELSPLTTLKGLRKLVDSAVPVEVPVNPPAWPYNRWVRLLGSAARETLVRGVLRIWVKQHSEGSENLASLNTPAIYIFNHLDDFDTPVVFKSLPWRIRKHLAIAAGADVLHDHKVLAVAARFGYAAFGFARQEPYLPSLEYVAKLIDKGWNIALAPEGKLSTNGKLLDFKSGIGLLAVELGVPVVPVKTIGLLGTVPIHSKWPKKHSRVTVRIGQPTYFDHDTSYDDATDRLQAIMESL